MDMGCRCTKARSIRLGSCLFGRKKRTKLELCRVAGGIRWSTDRSSTREIEFPHHLSLSNANARPPEDRRLCARGRGLSIHVSALPKMAGRGSKTIPTRPGHITVVMANRRASRKGNYIIRSPHALPFSHHLLHSHALHRSCETYVAVLLW